MAFPESTAWALNWRLLPGFPRVRAAGDPPSQQPLSHGGGGAGGVTAAKPAPPQPKPSTSRLNILILLAGPFLSKISLFWSLCGQCHPELPGAQPTPWRRKEPTGSNTPEKGHVPAAQSCRFPSATPRQDSQHSQSLQVVQPLEAVGPQVLDVVVMEMPVREESRVRTGARSIGLGRGGRRACGGGMDSDPSGSACVSRDKLTGQDGLRKPQSPRLEWPGATPFRLPIAGKNQRHSPGRGEAGSHQAPTRLEGRGPTSGPQLGLLLQDPAAWVSGQTHLWEPAANHCRQRVITGELSVTAGVSCGPAWRWRRVRPEAPRKASWRQWPRAQDHKVRDAGTPG